MSFIREVLLIVFWVGFGMICADLSQYENLKKRKQTSDKIIFFLVVFVNCTFNSTLQAETLRQIGYGAWCESVRLNNSKDAMVATIVKQDYMIRFFLTHSPAGEQLEHFAVKAFDYYADSTSNSHVAWFETKASESSLMTPIGKVIKSCPGNIGEAFWSIDQSSFKYQSRPDENGDATIDYESGTYLIVPFHVNRDGSRMEISRTENGFRFMFKGITTDFKLN